MKLPRRQRIAWTLFPRYSSALDVLNRNARVREWFRAHSRVPVLPTRFALYKLINETYLQNMPIDFIEFGVSSGESLRTWSEINSNPGSRFFGFDTFEGLPEDWFSKAPKGSFSLKGQIPVFKDSRVNILKGLFQESLPNFLREFKAKTSLVIHHDSDLYSSTSYCLTRMDEACVKGTILIFDEFSDPLHEFRAYEDYVRSYRRELSPIALAKWMGVPEQVAFVFD